MSYHHDVGLRLSSWFFSKNVGIKVSYTYCKNLQDSLKTQKNIENTFCIISNQLYRSQQPHHLYSLPKINERDITVV